ncbi:MAG: glycosyl transferase, family 9 [Frankiales bacterium]|nr:glycosyl transferase, family 9 [Frankiales bacterium]
MRVLALRALGLGDLLTAVPALRGLRAAQPTARITLAAPAPLTGLALLSGAVDEVVHAVPLAPLHRSLGGADLAVNLHGRGPQSTAVLVASRPGRLVSFGTTSTWRAAEHEVHRWCRLLEEAGMRCDRDDLRLAVPGPAPTRVLVHCGAALPSRRWPVERWAEVVRSLPTDVLLTGGPGERDRALQVARLAGLAADAVVAGRTTVLELASLVAAARLVVCVDTGVAHLATAYGTPSVVLFGPTDPALWGPPPEREQHVVLWAGRTGDNGAADVDPGLLALTPERVAQAAHGLLR